MFDQKELIELRDKALDKAKVPGLDLLWKLAYQNLAQAADNLDMIIAKHIIRYDDTEVGDVGEGECEEGS